MHNLSIASPLTFWPIQIHFYITFIWFQHFLILASTPVNKLKNIFEVVVPLKHGDFYPLHTWWIFRVLELHLQCSALIKEIYKGVLGLRFLHYHVSFWISLITIGRHYIFYATYADSFSSLKLDPLSHFRHKEGLGWKQNNLYLWYMILTFDILYLER